MIDIGAWLQVRLYPSLSHATTETYAVQNHQWLFRWAAYQALGRNNQNLTNTHALVVTLKRTDRLMGTTPLSFIIERVIAAPHGATERLFNFGVALYGDTDRTQSPSCGAAEGSASRWSSSSSWASAGTSC